MLLLLLFQLVLKFVCLAIFQREMWVVWFVSLIDPHGSKSYFEILLYDTALSSKEQNGLQRSCNVFLLVCFYTNGKNAYYRCKGGPHVFFFIAVLKLVHPKNVNFYMHFLFLFLNLAPWYLCPVQNNTMFQLNYNVQVSFSVTCL